MTSQKVEVSLNFVFTKVNFPLYAQNPIQSIHHFWCLISASKTFQVPSRKPKPKPKWVWLVGSIWSRSHTHFLKTWCSFPSLLFSSLHCAFFLTDMSLRYNSLPSPLWHFVEVLFVFLIILKCCCFIRLSCYVSTRKIQSEPNLEKI